MSTDRGRSGFRSPRGRSIVLAVAAPATLIGWLAATSLAAHARPVTPRSSAHRRVNQAPAVLQPTEVRVGHGFTNPSHPPTSSECEKAVRLACYSPLQLERAYDLRSLYAKGFTGRGRTIVIVDPFGSPTIRNDLKVFDHAFGLPAPPRFKVLAPVGRIPRYNPNNPSMTDKAGETTEDVEMAHALAPGANILLVETPKPETADGGGFPQMMKAEAYVIRHNLGDVISQSFSLPEQNLGLPFIVSLRSTFREAHRHRVTVLAASNDLGVTGPTTTGVFYEHRVVYWPASDPLVTAVGGTRLHLDAAGRRTSPDTAWNDSHSLAVYSYTHADAPLAGGGGASKLFRRPGYQNAVRQVVGNRRGVPDISMSASFTGGVLIYASYRVRASSYRGSPGWFITGGTSAATPEFAGIVAIADQYAKRRLGLLNPALYRLEREHARGIVDITKGNNTVSFPVAVGTKIKTFTLEGYRAKRGYDLVTGVGTVDGASLVTELAKR